MTQKRSYPFAFEEDVKKGLPSHTISDVNKYFKILEREENVNDKFKLSRFRVDYAFEKFEEVEEPMQVLKSCFYEAIHESINKAKVEGVDPDKIGVCISSRNLDPEINIPINKINANTVPAIFNRFWLVEQSKSKEQSIIGEPFSFKITLVKTKALPTLQKTSGTGRGKSEVRHQVNRKQLIEVKNLDNKLCLFIALELARIYNTDLQNKIISKDQFNALHNNRNIRYKNKSSTNITELALKLMQEAKIPKNLKTYDAETFCPMVEKFWNRQYGVDIYKIVIFAEYGSYKPVYATNCINYENEIVLYHSNNHFDAVRCMRQFFNYCNYYCFACEAPYNEQQRHSLSCKQHCLNCGRVGSKFPCKTDSSYYKLHCKECSKTFTNSECYLHHKNSRICNYIKKCLLCGHHYNLKVLKAHGLKKHECDVKLCQKCNIYHSGDCYIQKVLPKLSKPYRLAFFDFESTQTRKVETKTGLFNSL